MKQIDISECVKPTDVKSRMVVSSYGPASFIEQQYGDFFMPAREGLYRNGDIEPFIHPSMRLFSLKQTKTLAMSSDYVEIFDLNSATGAAVVDEAGRLLLTPAMLENKERYLFPQPTIPAAGIKLLKALIEYEITRIVRWTGTTAGYERRILELFQPQYRDTIDISVFLTSIGYVTNELHTFIGEDVWNYYSINMLGADIMIEKCADYRICEWYASKLGSLYQNA